MKKETKLSGAYVAPQCEELHISLEGCLLVSNLRSVSAENYNVADAEDDWL